MPKKKIDIIAFIFGFLNHFLSFSKNY